MMMMRQICNASPTQTHDPLKHRKTMIRFLEKVTSGAFVLDEVELCYFPILLHYFWYEGGKKGHN